MTCTVLGGVGLSRHMNLSGTQRGLRVLEEKSLLLILLNLEKAIKKPAAALFLWLGTPGYRLRPNQEKQLCFHQEAYFQYPKGLS